MTGDDANALISAARERQTAIRRAIELISPHRVRSEASDERAVDLAESIIDAEVAYQAVVDRIVEERGTH